MTAAIVGKTPVTPEDAKRFATLRARLGLVGHQLWRTDAADGQLVYFASRWGLVKELTTLEAVEAFCAQVGA